MEKLCLSTRDELVIIDLRKIVYFKANGNYTELNYIEGESRLLSIGLSTLEGLIRKAWPQEIPTIFVRLGRSFIINQTYLAEINVLRQRLILSDSMGHNHILSLPKPLLKEYKNKISELYFIRDATSNQD